MALGPTQPLTEISTRYISWGVGMTNLPSSCASYLEIQGASDSWSPKGMSRPVQELFYYFTVSVFGFVLSNVSDMFIFMILCGFCLLPT